MNVGAAEEAALGINMSLCHMGTFSFSGDYALVNKQRQHKVA